MNAQESLLWIGAGCMVAAVIGGGVKLAKMEIPQVTSVVRQILLFLVGGALLAASFVVPNEKTDGPRAETTTAKTTQAAPPPPEIPPPPAVRVNASPAALDFGDVADGEEASEFVSVSVEGVDDKDWSFKSTGTFFTAKKSKSGLSVALKTRPGRYRGTIVISSKAGEAIVKVRANIKPAGDEANLAVHDHGSAVVDEPPPAPTNVDISGRWNLNGGVVVFTSTGHTGRYQLTELTSDAFLGANVPMGQGSATVSGKEATLTGQNQFIGPWSAEVEVNGATMAGTLQYAGNQFPFVMQRL